MLNLVQHLPYVVILACPGSYKILDAFCWTAELIGMTVMVTIVLSPLVVYPNVILRIQ